MVFASWGIELRMKVKQASVASNHSYGPGLSRAPASNHNKPPPSQLPPSFYSISYLPIPIAFVVCMLSLFSDGPKSQSRSACSTYQDNHC